MRFKNAVLELKKGHIIRRKNWLKQCNIRLNSLGQMVDAQGQHVKIIGAWLVAEDWEVIA